MALQVVWKGRDPIKADVIFVHGLRGDSRKTWTSGNVFWPQQLLAEDLPEARIMCWSYDSSVANTKTASSQNSIFGHSDNLLSDISMTRMKAEEKTRPIIFIGHSLGGLVIKEAIIRSSEMLSADQDRKLGAISSCVAGIIFLGTPHRGSGRTNLGKSVARVAKVALRQPNKHLLRTLESDSDVLEKQRQSFTTVSQRISIACLFEENPVAGLGIIVPEQSACMDGFRVKRNSIPANHMEMCQFADSGDVGYRRTLHYITTFVDDVAVPTSPQTTAAILAQSSLSRDLDLDDKLIEDVPQQKAQLGAKMNERHRFSIRMTPPRSSRFVGRSRELGTLHQCLRPSSTYKPGQLITCVLHGLAGVGKTEIALEYCYLYSEGYKAIFWVPAKSKDDMDVTFRKFVKRLHLDSSSGDHSRQNITSWLEATEQPWLVIFDGTWDYQDIAPFLPEQVCSCGAVIITTQKLHLSSAADIKDIPIEPMDVDTGIRLLDVYIGQDIHEDIQRRSKAIIVESVGGLPLFVATIGAYVRKGSTLQEFIETCDDVEPPWVGLDVALSWHSGEVPEGAFDIALAKMALQAKELIDVLALLYGQHIPEDLVFLQHKDSCLEFLKPGNLSPKLRLAIILSLQNTSIVTRQISPAGNYLVMNNAVQRTVVHRLINSKNNDEARVKAFTQAFVILREGLPTPSLIMGPTEAKWSNSMTTIPHVINLLNVMNTFDLPVPNFSMANDPLEGIRLFIDAIIVLWHQGHVEEGLRMVKLTEQRMNDAGFHTGPDRANLETIFGQLERIKGVEKQHASIDRFGRALKIWKLEASGSVTQGKHQEALLIAKLEVAESLLHKPSLEMETVDEAERIYEDCLRVFRMSSTTEERVLNARCLLTTAFCQICRGKTDEAYRRAQEVRRVLSTLSQEPLITHRIDFGIACIFSQTGKFDEALELHNKVMKTRESSFGLSSFWTMLSMHAIGALYASTKDYKKASRFLTQALCMAENGSWTAATACIKFRLAKVLSEQDLAEGGEKFNRDLIRSLDEDARMTFKILLEPDLIGLDFDEEVKFCYLQPTLEERFYGYLDLKDRI